jgi:hypothetical protein
VQFFLFLVLTALLYLRPTDFVPGLEGFQLYLVVISACILLSLDVLFREVSLAALTEKPIGAFVLGLLGVSVISNLFNGNNEAALQFGVDFAKVLVFYFLMTGLINSSGRLRSFLNGMVLINLVLISLGLLNFYGIVSIPAFDSENGIMQQADPSSGDLVTIRRFTGTGSYGDPNDICELIVPSMILSLKGLTERPRHWGRILWLGPFLVFGNALQLTQSRGGLLGLLAGLGVLFWSRFGWKKSALIATVVMPAMLMVFGGRQASFSVSTGTGQARLQQWDAGFEMMKSSPLLGTGTGILEQVTGHAAHNSFMQMYTELGFLGGTLFFGMFYHAIRVTARLGSSGTTISDPEIRKLRPFILAVLVSYAISEFGLTHPHATQTYAILGLATTCLHLAHPHPPLIDARLSGRMLYRICACSALFLGALYLYVRLSVRYYG